MKLTQEEISEAKSLMQKLNNLYKIKATLEVDKKEKEKTLKYEVASVCHIKDKNGAPQASKVKMSLLLALIDELFLQKDNKKLQELDVMEQYRIGLKQEGMGNYVNSLVSIIEEIGANNIEIKEAFRETSILSKEMLEAIALITKEYYHKVKEDKLLEAGFTVRQTPKDNTEILELKEVLEGLL